MSTAPRQIPPVISSGRSNPLIRNIRQYPLLYVMCAVGVLWFVVFRYIPMGGLVVAFQKFKLAKGLFASEFVGFKNFLRFFHDPYAFRIIRKHVPHCLLQPDLGDSQYQFCSPLR